MCKEILSQLHEAHQGAVGTVDWPGLANDIINVVSSCRQCQNHLTSNIKQPITIKPNLIHLFQEAVADFCIHAGKLFHHD